MEEPATACFVPASPIGPAAGNYPVEATCDGANFTASSSANATIAPASQGTLSVTATPATIVFGDTSALSTQGGTGDGAVTFAVTAGGTACSISGSTLTGIGVGPCTVTATKAADGNYSATTATAQVQVTPKADLEVAKDANRFGAQPGEEVVYSIVVANAGPNNAAGVTLSDVPPASLVDVEWTCVAAASSVPCPAAPGNAGTGPLNATFDLGIGQHIRFDLSATVQAAVGTQIHNIAQVAAPGATDPVPANNAATASLSVVPLGVFVDGFESVVARKLSFPSAEKARVRPR